MLARVPTREYNVSMHNMLSVPEEILRICRAFYDAGYEAYIVGGCVRDLYLDRTPKDWDITTNATPDIIQSLFTETFYENEYGTVGIVTESSSPSLKVIEATPYRTESNYSNSRHPDEVEFTTSLSDDLLRRDFTINAIAYDPLSRTLIDEHNGLAHLRERRLVTVGDPNARLCEDALRILRAIRLSVELDFIIDADTMQAIAAHSALLAHISKERIRDEFNRILLSPRPMQGLFIAERLGIVQYIIPELVSAVGVRQNQAHSFDVFEHLLRTMQHAADKQWSFDVRLAGLLHDIGKPATRQWSDQKQDYTFHGHEVVGARMTKHILRELRYPKETIDYISTLVRWHMFFSDPDTVTLSAVRRTIARVGKEHVQDLLNLRICDRIGTGRPKEQPFRLRKYMAMIDQAMRDPITVGMLAIDGKRTMDVTGEKPGPRIGWILHALLEEVLNEPTKNTTEYLESRAQELVHLSDNELRVLGEHGKDTKEAEEAAEIEKLHAKHHVS